MSFNQQPQQQQQRQMQFQQQTQYQQQVQMQPSFVNLSSAGYQQKQARREELRSNMQKTKFTPVASVSLTADQEVQAKKFTESAKTESVEFLQNLLKEGVFPNRVSENGDYATHIIMGRADAPRKEFFKMFFDLTHKYEVNINSQNKRGQTILHLACKLENPEISEYLLSKGADPNIQDIEGNTCVHILASTSTVSARNEELLRQCLSYGGNIEIANNSGLLANQVSPHVAHQRLFMQQKIDFDEGVIGGDVEVALSWTNMNDLDLHCVCECGSHINYSSKVCNSCHGFLDVDMNVQPTSNTPVEHIYWAKVPKGQFQFKVVFYRNHSSVPRQTDYLVIVKVHEKLVFEKAGSHTSEKAEHVIVTFQFDDKGEFSVINDNQFKPKVAPPMNRQMPFMNQQQMPPFMNQQMPFMNQSLSMNQTPYQQPQYPVQQQPVRMTPSMQQGRQQQQYNNNNIPQQQQQQMFSNLNFRNQEPNQ